MLSRLGRFGISALGQGSPAATATTATAITATATTHLRVGAVQVLAATPVQQSGSRPYSPEPTGDGGHASQSGSKHDSAVRVAVLEVQMKNMEAYSKDSRHVLESIASGTTPYQQAQTKLLDQQLGQLTKQQGDLANKLNEVANDVHKLVLWRTRMVTVGAMMGGAASTGMALAIMPFRFLA